MHVRSPLPDLSDAQNILEYLSQRGALAIGGLGSLGFEEGCHNSRSGYLCLMGRASAPAPPPNLARLCSSGTHWPPDGRSTTGPSHGRPVRLAGGWLLASELAWSGQQTADRAQLRALLAQPCCHLHNAHPAFLVIVRWCQPIGVGGHTPVSAQRHGNIVAVGRDVLSFCIGSAAMWELVDLDQPTEKPMGDSGGPPSSSTVAPARARSSMRLL